MSNDDDDDKTVRAQLGKTGGKKTFAVPRRNLRKRRWRTDDGSRYRAYVTSRSRQSVTRSANTGNLSSSSSSKRIGGVDDGRENNRLPYSPLSTFFFTTMLPTTPAHADHPPLPHLTIRRAPLTPTTHTVTGRRDR